MSIVTWVLVRMTSPIPSCILPGIADEIPDEGLNAAATCTGGSALATNEMKYEELYSVIPAAMRNGLGCDDLMH